MTVTWPSNRSKPIRFDALPLDANFCYLSPGWSTGHKVPQRDDPIVYIKVSATTYCVDFVAKEYTAHPAQLVERF